MTESKLLFLPLNFVNFKYSSGVVSVSLILVTLLSSVHCFKLPAPEFAEPVKNITAFAGSNIELFCNVRNLGTNRVMWLKKEGDKENLLGISNLVITKNPKVSISLLPSSGDVSQCILYINKVDQDEDSGIYHCIVNSSPMLLQVATVEITEKPISQSEANHRATATTSIPMTTKPPDDTTPMPEKIPGGRTEVGETSSSTPSPCIQSCGSQGERNAEFPSQESNVICIDVGRLWFQTRQKTQYFLSWFYDFIY